MPTLPILDTENSGSSSMEQRLYDFIHAASRSFNKHDSEIARQLATALGEPFSQVRCLKPAKVPACKALSEPAPQSGDELAGLLLACADDLHWKAPGFGKLPAEIAAGLAVAEILGPLGIFHHPRIRFGVLLQGPNLHYPSHRHAAEELYLIIQGGAEWAVDNQDFTARGSGEFVHHQSRQIHAMNTGEKPMLAIWGWVGDIAAPSYSLQM